MKDYIIMNSAQRFITADGKFSSREEAAVMTKREAEQLAKTLGAKGHFCFIMRRALSAGGIQ